METVIADARYLAPDDHDQRPRTDESVLPVYLKAGFNVFNIANNPVMYHGLGCFMRHLDLLDEAGVVYGGGGRNISAARKPAIIERNGTKIAFVCRTSVGLLSGGATAEKAGVARFGFRVAYEPRDRGVEVPGSPPIVHAFPNAKDQQDLIEDIRTARSHADVVVVSWHWGASPASGGTGDIVTYQVEMGHLAIESGADMVVGHHPHVLQAIEVYKGKPILYSLGNYVHDLDSMGEKGKRLRAWSRAAASVTGRWHSCRTYPASSRAAVHRASSSRPKPSPSSTTWPRYPSHMARDSKLARTTCPSCSKTTSRAKR